MLFNLLFFEKIKFKAQLGLGLIDFDGKRLFEHSWIYKNHSDTDNHEFRASGRRILVVKWPNSWIFRISDIPLFRDSEEFFAQNPPIQPGNVYFLISYWFSWVDKCSKNRFSSILTNFRSRYALDSMFSKKSRLNGFSLRYFRNGPNVFRIISQKSRTLRRLPPPRHQLPRTLVALSLLDFVRRKITQI